jgi:hypothetical protein
MREQDRPDLRVRQEELEQSDRLDQPVEPELKDQEEQSDQLDQQVEQEQKEM